MLQPLYSVTMRQTCSTSLAMYHCGRRVLSGEEPSYYDDVTQLFDAYLTGLSIWEDRTGYINQQQRKVVDRLLQLDNKYSSDQTVLDYKFTCVGGKSNFLLHYTVFLITKMS